jgi:hypothetical protein
MNTELATIPQPVQKETVLSPEIQKAVRKWSNSFFRASIPTNLMTKSVITEIKDERAKLLTAEFLYGERNGTLKEIPYDGSEIGNRIDNLDEESLWLYGGGLSQAPADFSEKSQSKFLISTGKTKNAQNVRAKGKWTAGAVREPDRINRKLAVIAPEKDVVIVTEPGKP